MADLWNGLFTDPASELVLLVVLVDVVGFVVLAIALQGLPRSPAPPSCWPVSAA